MATPGERFGTWLNALAVKWRTAVGEWCGQFIASGFVGFMDVVGTKMAPQLKPLLDKLEAGGLPPELQPIIDEIKKPTGETAGLHALSFSNRLIGSIKGDIFSYLTRSITNVFSYLPYFFLPDAALLIEYYFRHIIPDKETLYFHMRDHGIPPDEVDKLLKAKEIRFPSDIVAPLWLRDKVKYEDFWDDVYSVAGIEKPLTGDDKRIEALKELAYNMPSFRDVVGFLAHEVFEPNMIAKYGLDDEWGAIDKTLFDKVGLREDMALNYWRDHWQHASWSQIVEMLHRGLLKEEDVWDWFRLVEIPPFWRDNLIKTMWSVPGRIELRMMAQYGLVDKPFILDILEKDGLAEEYRSVVADMMIVRGVRTDIQTRYAKKWINSEEVKAEIDSYGLSPAIGDRLYKWIVTNAAAERTGAEKDLTAAEIIKGVKKNIISWNDGVEQLIALGYDEAEAYFKLAIDLEVVEAVTTTELNTRVDTIRRRRRQRLISRDEEISSLVEIDVDTALATAYADNDDLRLVKVAVPTPPEVILEYQTDDGKVKVETIRLSRRQRRISRDEETMALMELEMPNELAISFADNDDLRLAAVKPAVPLVVILLYQTELGKVTVDTFRRARRDRLISRDEEIRLLTDLDMPTDLATAYADNDDLRLTPVKIEVPPKVISYYQTEAGKIDVDTIRRLRQQRQLTRVQTAEEIRSGAPPVLVTGDEAREREIELLMALEMSEELATAYANNDDLRLIKEAAGGAE